MNTMMASKYKRRDDVGLDGRISSEKIPPSTGSETLWTREFQCIFQTLHWDSSLAVNAVA
jgi:hypothetical protein